ncbi:MAG: hypothetical protein HQM15_00710 [Deltaproteobacteria bacterium]|nr:hypothetical protein [Deltaproteobacteria bacterium]
MGKKILFFILLAVFSLDFAKTVFADPPYWAPAYGYRYRHYRDHDDGDRRYEERRHRRVRTYRYIYYPEQEVYYYPVTRRYYWREPSGWRVGLRLPGGISIGASSSFPIELDSDRPYIYHEETRIKFR